MLKNTIKKSPLKLVTILVFICLSVFSIYEYFQTFRLKSYINFINETYKIPTGQSVESVIPKDFKFTREDAFGVVLVDLVDLFRGKYLLDPNHENKFYWIDSKGKQIDLSDKSEFLYIGIPLKPEDINKEDLGKIAYVNQTYKDLISVFERSGFEINRLFDKMDVYGFDNGFTVNIAAFENSKGTKCEIREPSQYSFSEFSKAIGMGDANVVGYNSLAYIYVACTNGK